MIGIVQYYLSCLCPTHDLAIEKIKDWETHSLYYTTNSL